MLLSLPGPLLLFPIPTQPGAEPTAVSSLRLATAMAAQGQARAAGEEPVKGSPYEWVLIGL